MIWFKQIIIQIVFYLRQYNLSSVITNVKIVFNWRITELFSAQQVNNWLDAPERGNHLMVNSWGHQVQNFVFFFKNRIVPYLTYVSTCENETILAVELNLINMKLDDGSRVTVVFNIVCNFIRDVNSSKLILKL